MEKYMSVTQAAEAWNLTERRVRRLCQDGRVSGAIKLGWQWSVPSDAPKPFDGRAMRHYKVSYIRLGSIDVTMLNRLRADNPVQDKLYSNINTDEFFSGLIRLGMAIDKSSFSNADILAVLKLNPPRSVSYADALMISAFKSVLLRSARMNHKYTSAGLLEIHAAFTQGWDDRGGTAFRIGVITNQDGQPLEVDKQMETFFTQYSREWKNLHPVFKASLLFAALITDRPFDSHNGLFAVLAFSSYLMSEGFLPPLFDEDSLEEILAAAALAVSRGNYEDLARVFERGIGDSYTRIFRT